MIRRRDGDGRHLGVDQGDRTVFHFGGRVALCVDVGDLLEFERTFQRRGVVVPASQVDEVVRVGEDFREVGDPVVQAEHLFQHGGQIEQMLGDLARALLVDRTLDAGDHQRQHREYRYLSREGFGRSHADLRPYVDVSAGIGSPGDRRADHVADAIDERTVLLGQLDSGQRVGRFARLRYGDHDVVGINHRIAVTELRSVFHFDRNAAEILDQVLPDERCVPRGAASHEDDAPGVEKPLSVVHDARQDHVVRLGVDPAPNAVHDGLGLLEDLLEHEVRIAALFELGDAELQLLDVDLALLVVERYDLQRVVAIHDHYLAVIDIDDLVRIFHDRRRVRCQEKLLVADTDDHRAAAACRDDLILVALLHYGDSVCADHLLQCLLDGLQQRAVVRRTDVFDQIDQYLRVSVALECVTVFDQRLFQHPVIFDAVYHCGSGRYCPNRSSEDGR